jgi:cation transporter-like permease
MDALTRFRYISVAVQYALIVLAVIGYVLYSNGGSPVLTQVAVVGIIVCLFSRLAVTLVVALRRRNHG